MKHPDIGFLTGIAIATALAVALAGCGADGTGAAVQSPTGGTANATPTAVAEAQKNDTPVDPAIVSADNAFGLSLLDALLPESNGGNIAISPLSVALALQVLYNGAAGSTQQAMAQTLDLGTLGVEALNNDNAALQASLIDPDPAVQLVVANGLWFSQSSSKVSSSFTKTDQNFYGATLGDLAGAPNNVNAWVDSETQGLITQVLPPGTYTGPIIANVLYFKGQWTSSFNPDNTAAAPFTLSDGSQMSAQMMQQNALFAIHSGTLYGINYQSVRLPYGQGRFNLLIILPDAGANITSFVANITVKDLNDVGAQLFPITLSIELPRFTASYGTSLIAALQFLGMGIAFSPSADFSALAPGFSVGVVEHKTAVEVNETGTVAAAATVISPIDAAFPPIVMNHPFFYAIEDGKTGELLFVGVLMNPNGG